MRIGLIALGLMVGLSLSMGGCAGRKHLRPKTGRSFKRVFRQQVRVRAGSRAPAPMTAIEAEAAAANHRRLHRREALDEKPAAPTLQLAR